MNPAGRAAGQRATAVAAVFRAAAADLSAECDRQAALRPELAFEEVPAPKRLAPFAAAFAATVCADGAEVGTGRLILLYDPAGQPGWAGPLRIVAQIRAEVDPEIAVDPLLGPVGWSWLTEALDERSAAYGAPSGTVTRVITEGFGAKSEDPAATEFELRASWSPAGPWPPADRQDAGDRAGPVLEVGTGLAAHLAAWCDALCAAAGLTPQVPGPRAAAPGLAALPGPRPGRRAAGNRGEPGWRATKGHRAPGSGDDR